MTSINLTAQPAKAIRALVQAGAITRAEALAHAKATLGRYAASGKSAAKLRRWERLVAELADTPAPATHTTAPKPRKPRKARKAPATYARAEAAPAGDRIDELLAKRILTNAERDELRAAFGR